MLISDRSNCVVEIQWKAPVIVNAPKVCFYAVNMRYNGSTRVNFNVSQTSFIEVLQPNIKYEFYIQSINNQSCYSNEYPKCPTNLAFGSTSAFANYTMPSTCSTTTTSTKPTNKALKNYLNITLKFIIFIHFWLSW